MDVSLNGVTPGRDLGWRTTITSLTVRKDGRDLGRDGWLRSGPWFDSGLALGHTNNAHSTAHYREAGPNGPQEQPVHAG